MKIKRIFAILLAFSIIQNLLNLAAKPNSHKGENLLHSNPSMTVWINA